MTGISKQIKEIQEEHKRLIKRIDDLYYAYMKLRTVLITINKDNPTNDFTLIINDVLEKTEIVS